MIGYIVFLSCPHALISYGQHSNGKTNGITLPSSAGQEAVIRKAYAKAGLAVDETDYIEVSSAEK